MKLRITVEGKTYDVEVEILEESPGDAARDDPPVRIPDSVLNAPAPPDVMPEDRICRSPIAGVVIAIPVATGQKVRKDDPLVTIEAMKMETRIAAPADGTVETIQVTPGDAVKTGQVLLELS